MIKNENGQKDKIVLKIKNEKSDLKRSKVIGGTTGGSYIKPSPWPKSVPKVTKMTPNSDSKVDLRLKEPVNNIKENKVN